VKKKKTIIKDNENKFKNLIEEIMSTSLKKDIKGGKPKFKAQFSNQSIVNNIEIFIFPFKEYKLRV